MELKKNQKILISGYYGFDNFGDDAILYVIINDIQKTFPDAKITVISNNPEKIQKNYGVESVYKFDFKNIFLKMREYDLFISGGGSLLQDITSFQSLIYYLLLILTAEFLKLKTSVYAQGIGPINSKFGKIFARLILEKVNLITVRDKESHDFLRKMGIKSLITADPVWNIDKGMENKEIVLSKKLGVQLRNWHSLNNETLESIASLIVSNFESYEIILFSLQDSVDLDIIKQLEKILKVKYPELNIKVFSGLSIKNSLSLIKELDFLIAMRFHAILAALKFNIPTLALSYDPKVMNLSKEAGIPFTNVETIDIDKLNLQIQAVINDKEFSGKLREFSAKKEQETRQNIDLLVKMLSVNMRDRIDSGK